MRGVKVIGLFNLLHAARRTGRALWLSLQGGGERPRGVEKSAHPLFCRMFGDVQ